MRLEVNDLAASYGRARVLDGVHLDVAAGEVTALLGRNGAGKSTTLKSIIGWVNASAGSVRLDGADLSRLPMHEIARLGVAFVPEDRRIFTGLSVRENLLVGVLPARPGLAPWSLDRALTLFPELAGMLARRADRLSGGEQQMLTLARALMGNPGVMLLDEPSEGLAPLVVERMVQAIAALKQAGLAVLMSEQNLTFARRIADRCAIIEQGRIRFRGSMAELASDPELARAYLAV